MVALPGVIAMDCNVAGPLGVVGEVVVEPEFPPQLASISKPASTGTNNNLRIVFHLWK
jgi:hypothetical protein